ncbi:MAG: DUF4381 family protein [Bacteroidales bacterium]|nr:DUF4381 family protein [Bacteroidales bacterium]
MKGPYGIVFLFVICFSIFPGASQAIKGQAVLRLVLDTPAIRIGEQVNALLILSDVEYPAATRMPELHDTLTAGIEVLEQGTTDTVKNENGFFTLRRQYRITSFDSGSYVIRGLQAIMLQSGDTILVTAPPVDFDVFTVSVAEEDELRDIHGPLKIPISWKEILPWILLLVGALLLVLAFRWYIKHRKSGRPMITIFNKPGIPPHQIALTALEALRRKKLWQEGRYKEYHSELTEILRTYIDERFGIPAMEMVSWEILDALEEVHELNRSQMSGLLEMLTLADMVKFAKAIPLADENDHSMRSAVNFVKATTPQEAAGESESQLQQSDETNPSVA